MIENVNEISKTKLTRHLLIKLISGGVVEDHTLSGYGYLTKDKLDFSRKEDTVMQLVDQAVTSLKHNKIDSSPSEDQE